MDKIRHDLDVVIIGGGPAGLSAALWCDELGLKALIIESEAEFGGQLRRVFNPISNHLGALAANGAELREQFLEQITGREFEKKMRAPVTAVDLVKKTVTLAGGETISARALIIATGVRRRKLGVEGEDRFAGRGIIESGKKEVASAKDKKILIVGGGDAAIENALILSEVAERVIVVHRRDEFTARAEFLEAAKSAENIEFLPEHILTGITGEENTSGVEVLNRKIGERKSLAVEIVLIRIGVEPNSDIFAGLIDRDDCGYIKVDSRCETSEQGIYAVGDVANPLSPTISGAVGMGATAARAAYEYLLQTADDAR